MPENKKARRTIKLRPIGAQKTPGATPVETPTGGPEAQTVKLSPITPTSSEGAAPPAAPTVKLSPAGTATPPAAPTVKLSPAGTATPPAAPTVKLSPAGATSAATSGNGDDDRTQPLRRAPQAAATRPGSLIPGVSESLDSAAPSDKTKIAPPTPAPAPSAAPPTPAPVEDDENESEETVSMSRAELEEDATQRVSANRKEESAAVPGANQTIKLRPSTASQPAAPMESQVSAKPAAASTIKLKPKPPAGSEEQEQTAAIAKQTIKLVPNKGGAQAPKPGDPTVKLTESQAPSQPKPGDPTVKLTPKSDAAPAAPSPGAQTVVLPSAGAEEAEKPAMPKTKLSIKKQESSQQAEMHKGQLAPGSESFDEEETSSDEPSIIFTLVAVFALIVLGFVFVIMAAQYSNHWMGQNINIPVLSDMVK